MRFLFYFIVFLSTFLHASIGTITSLDGKANILRNNKNIVAVIGNEIEKKDIISTELNSKLKITLIDNTIVSIGKESTLNIEEYVFDTQKTDDSQTELNFVKGAFHTITGQIGKINPSKFKLKTKSASIGIRGTEIYGNENQVACTKGVIDVTSFGQTNIIPSGNFVDTYIDKLPSEVKILDKNILDKIKTKLDVNRDNKSMTFSTKNSISKKGKTTVTANNAKVTLKEDGTILYEPKEGSQGEDTIVIINIDGDETTTEIVSISISNDSSIPNELNLEQISTTKLSDLNSSSFSKDSSSNNVSIIYNNKETEEIIDTKKENINSIVLEKSSITVDEGSSLKTGKLVAKTTASSSTNLKYFTTSTISGFTLNSDGSYSFDSKNSSYDSLNVNQNKLLTIPIIVKDDTGVETSSSLEIKVLGNTDLSGKHLGALLNSNSSSTATSNNFTLNSSSKMNVYTNKIVLGQYDVVKSVELSYGNFVTTGYSSHSDIGKIGFSQDVNQTSYSGNYTIHSDNVGEFIVGLSSESWNINSELYSYKNIFYNGLVSSKSVLDNSKIYTYKIYKGIKVDSDSSSVLNSVYIDNSTDKYVKINTKTGSITPLNLSNSIEKSAQRFNVARLNSDGTITAKSYGIVEDTSGAVVESESTISGQLYGTIGQGIGVQGDITDSKNSSSNAKEIVKKSKMIETYYLDKNATKSNTSTGIATFEGLNSKIYSIKNLGTSNSNNKMKFDINKDTGTFSNGVISDKTTDLFTINGNVSSLSSYYINDDNFGVKIDSYSSSNSNTLVENSSWMVAISDKVNSDGTFSDNIDNESSWGYWTANIKDTANKVTNINAYSTWVAGAKTDVNVVQSLLDSSVMKTINFKGNIIGAVLSDTNVIDAIKLDTNNSMNIKFLLGSQNNTFSGNFGFNTVGGKPWSGDFKGTATSSGFSGDTFSNLSVNSNTSIRVNGSSINGNYYGTGDIKSVGGSIEIDTSDGKVMGSFKADKQ